MKSLIIFKTNTGFSKRYAEMLSRRVVPSEIKDIRKVHLKDLRDCDHIFFIGPLRNNVILGLNKFLKFYEHIKDKNIYIIANGIEPYSEEKKENVIFANGLDLYHVRLYFVSGGMDISKMSPLKRKMFQVGIKMAAKKQNIGEDLIKQRFETPIDLINSSNLDRVVEVYHRLNAISPTDRKEDK